MLSPRYYKTQYSKYLLSFLKGKARKARSTTRKAAMQICQNYSGNDQDQQKCFNLINQIFKK